MKDNNKTITLNNFLSIIRERFISQIHISLSEFNKPDHSTENIDSKEIKFLIDNSQAVTEILADENNIETVVEYIFDLFKIFTYGKNQFINFTDVYEDKIKELYRTFLNQTISILKRDEPEDSTTNEYKRLVLNHRNKLRAIIRNYFNDYSGKEESYDDLMQTVISSNYSANLQLDLLHIEPGKLKEPVIDVGCGEEANLVKHLINKGKDVTGIDRLIKNENENLIKKDWLQFKFEPDTYGTIISHHSFTTNFIYHHNKSEKMAADYAQKFMEILKSLKIGGAFYYTPGVPFFERYLKDLPEYKMDVKMFVQNLEAVKDISYTTIIKRFK